MMARLRKCGQIDGKEITGVSKTPRDRFYHHRRLRQTKILSIAA
ncbi:MAG: hypothetical protein ABII12_02405 [Planctomycetota bacterium]